MPEPPPEERFRNLVERKARRRLRARREQQRTVWFSLGLFGIVGWSVAVPALIGVALGVWLDTRFGGRVSWTLTLLLVGVAIGCANAWYWVKDEMRDENHRQDEPDDRR